MIKRQQLAPLFLALSLGATPLFAQTTAVEQSGTPESASTGADKGADSKSAPPPKGSTPKSTAPATGNDSPFDYRSSEQISEDVPVSFPVDI